MSSIPIIRLEVEGMRHAIVTALTDHQATLDADIQAAVTAYCTPDNIGRVVQQHVSRELQTAVVAAVERFFRWGGGREAVESAVTEAIASTLKRMESKR